MDVDGGASSTTYDNSMQENPSTTNGDMDKLQGAPPRISSIVAHLLHNKLANYHAALFQYHPKADIYTIQTSLKDVPTDKVIQVGREDMSVKQGYDYGIARVNKRSGQLEDYIPTKLFNFQAIFSDNPSALFGNKSSKQVDYLANFAVTPETSAEQRRALTQDFGSEKKKKMQAAAARRRITENSSVMSPSFLSSDALKKEVDEENSLNISSSAQPERSVLPPVNKEAKTPADVYPFSLFISDSDVTLMETEVFSFFNDPKSSEIITSDCSEFLYRSIVGNIHEENPTKACLTLMLVVMVKSYKIIKRNKVSGFYLPEKDWKALNYPSSVKKKVLDDFFPGEFVKDSPRSSGKLNINIAHKDRLLSHLLCLSVVLNENFSLPVTPWLHELGANEKTMKKILIELGCSIEKSENAASQTTHIARLKGPPRDSNTKGKFSRTMK